MIYGSRVGIISILICILTLIIHFLDIVQIKLTKLKFLSNDYFLL